MKRIFMPLVVGLSLLLPLTSNAGERNDHRHSDRTESSAGRPGSGKGNNGNSHKGDNNKNKWNNNKHNNHDKNGNNHKWNGNANKHPGGNNGYRPGGNTHHRPGNGNYRPGNNNHRPGHGSSVTAPGGNRRPVPVYNYRPGHHHKNLGKMVKKCIHGGRYDNVWLVGPGQYAVRYYRNGIYYMQYIWPETGRYGTPFRIIKRGPGEWYAYDNRNQLYYEDDNTLRISLNGSALNPWTLIPSVELNINL
ncbi:MAG: hypothetical protein K2M13_07925 [Muribaculaceae bacterium]|nr:hypothetical protein [Muribaculaceae bacterium]